MRNLIDDTQGIAAGIYVVVLFIFLAGTFMFLMTGVFNGLITTFNLFVAQDMVSDQTRNSFDFIVSVVAAMTVFILFGAALWGWVRAHESKTEGYP